MLKIKEIFKNKTSRIILVLGFLVIILIILKIITPKEKSIAPVEVLPSPTPIPTLLPQSGIGDPNFRQSLQPTIEASYPLFSFIPFKTDSWSIDYLGPLKLKVILTKDTKEIRQEVLDWISSKGVDPATHKIEWKSK